MTHATDEFTSRAAITAVLSRQEAALNASSTEAVMPLYAEGGVFMPPFGPSAVGKAALQQACDAVFRTITLHVKFKIADWFRWRARADPRGSSAYAVSSCTGRPRRARATATFAALPPSCSTVEPSGRSTMSINASPTTTTPAMPHSLSHGAT